MSAHGDAHADLRPTSILDKVIYYGGALGMLALFGVVIYTVGARYLFNRPPLWSADVPNLMFIWLVFIVAGLTAKLGPQIRVVFFIEKMPPQLHRALLIVAHCAILVMLGFFVIYSLPIIELSSGETMLSTGWPGSVFFYALPVGSLIMAYYQVWALIQLVRPAGPGHPGTGH